MITTFDVSVCFPGRPCHLFTPLSGYVINLTAALTPASGAIAVGCFAILGVGLLLIVLGLIPRAGRMVPRVWLVAVTTGLFLVGSAVRSAVEALFSALSLLYGADGPGGTALIGEWPIVRLASGGVALLGFVALVLTALIATVRPTPRAEGVLG